MLLRAAVDSGLTPHFTYLSAIGASVKSRNEYVRVRGRVQAELMVSGLPYLIAQPSFITGDDRDEPRPLERYGAKAVDGFLKAVAVLGGGRIRDRYGSMTGTELGDSLVRLALASPRGRVVADGVALRAARRGGRVDMPITTTNPATGELIRSFPELSSEEIQSRIARGRKAFESWRRTSVADRAGIVRRAGDIMDTERDAFGRLMTLEMGKPLTAAIEEAAKCATACRFYADHAEQFLAPEPVTGPGLSGRDYVAYQPIGIVLAVMPWNFPFWQVIRFAAPAMVAGNVGLLKHASNVPQCALAIEDIFRRAGAPDGVFQTLLIGSAAVAEVIAHDSVAAVTLTGSEGAGSTVGSAAGKALKKSVLELGGSDPFIVMPSADIALAASTAVKARTINNGQSCIAAKRFIVHETVADDFERRFVEGMRALRVGDPMDQQTQIGPLAMPQLLDELEEQVRTTVTQGGRVLLGGQRLDRPGHFSAP